MRNHQGWGGWGLSGWWFDYSKVPSGNMGDEPWEVISRVEATNQSYMYIIHCIGYEVISNMIYINICIYIYIWYIRSIYDIPKRSNCLYSKPAAWEVPSPWYFVDWMLGPMGPQPCSSSLIGRVPLRRQLRCGVAPLCIRSNLVEKKWGGIGQSKSSHDISLHVEVTAHNVLGFPWEKKVELVVLCRFLFNCIKCTSPWWPICCPCPKD